MPEMKKINPLSISLQKSTGQVVRFVVGKVRKPEDNSSIPCIIFSYFPHHQLTFFPLSHKAATTHFKKHLSSQLFPMKIHKRLFLMHKGKLEKPPPPEKSVDSLTPP